MTNSRPRDTLPHRPSKRCEPLLLEMHSENKTGYKESKNRDENCYGIRENRLIRFMTSRSALMNELNKNSLIACKHDNNAKLQF